MLAAIEPENVDHWLQLEAANSCAGMQYSTAVDHHTMSVG